MTSKCGVPVTATSYHKLPEQLGEIHENGIDNEMLQDDVFHEGGSTIITTKQENNENIATRRIKSESGSFSGGSDCSINLTTPAPRKKSVLKRVDSSKPVVSKRVSFSSFDETKRRVSNATDCFSYMKYGTEFLKLRLGREYQRMYQLNDDLDYLHWRPSTKRPEKALLPIDILLEVRAGKNTSTFREQGSAYSEDCCFSLIVGPNYDSIDLVAKNPEEAGIWITGMRLLLTQTKVSEKEDESDTMRERWLKQQFRMLDKNKTGLLDEAGVMALLKKLRITAPEHITRQLLQETYSQSVASSPLNNGESSSSSIQLSENDFCTFFIKLTTRQEMYFLMVKYSSNGLYLTKDDLQIFLETEQRLTSCSTDHALDIINQCEPTEEGRKQQILGLDGLTKYFFEKDCNIFDWNHSCVCEDMRKPLSQYFIATSHNTYLIEDQIKGHSSVQGYISSLQRGCRCVELECWNGTDGEPIIYHGHTQTTKILFVDVIRAIEEYAFYASEYPLILSLENHCSPDQQLLMVKYLKVILADCLYDNAIKDDFSGLPSPEALKGKIIIKNKKLPRRSTRQTSDESSPPYGGGTTVPIAQGGEVSEEEEEGTEEIIQMLLHSSDGEEPQKNMLLRRASSSNGYNGQVSHTGSSLAKVTRLITLTKELSDLVTICKSVAFNSFQKSQASQKIYEMCSLSESRAYELSRDSPEDFVMHTKRFLTRVYPAVKRIDSSNYNPVEFWNCGCQLVGLNYQFPGLAMDLNYGRFLKNGSCGYTLKPSVMREEVSCFSPHMKHEIPGVCPVKLTIKIISGYRLPKPRGSTSKVDTVDPYVRLELYGLPADCFCQRTSTVSNNGYNPVFDETFEFRVLLPELALLRFLVLDDEHIGDCFIGQYTIPVDCIKQGYRTVYLSNSLGDNLGPTSLFVHVSIVQQTETGQKKGFSIKKKKDVASIKHLGVKVIDDTFKMSHGPLKEAMSLRDTFQTSLTEYREQCGCGNGSVKTCLRAMTNRINTFKEKNADSSFSLSITGDKIPVLQYEGDIPAVLQKLLTSFETFLQMVGSVLEQGSDVYERLTHARRSALEWHDDLTKKTDSKKKALESFSWNVNMLSGQADLLKSVIQQSTNAQKEILALGTSGTVTSP